MKTIIVPTDLSPDTEAALSVAADIARVYHATITLLHSVQYQVLPIGYEGAIPYTIDSATEAEEVLKRLISQKKYENVAITIRVINFGDGLVSDVTDRAADLIVMTSKGTSGLEEILIGSNAEAIVRHAHCPVLVVKEPIPHFQPVNIVCAIDVDDRLKGVRHYPFQMGEKGLNRFLYVSTPTDGRVAEGVRDWMRGFAHSKGITDYDFHIREARTVPEGILQYAEEMNADLIVLFTHGHKGLRHLLWGSVAEDVLNHARVPVLVMRM